MVGDVAGAQRRGATGRQRPQIDHRSARVGIVPGQGQRARARLGQSALVDDRSGEREVVAVGIDRPAVIQERDGPGGVEAARGLQRAAVEINKLGEAQGGQIGIASSHDRDDARYDDVRPDRKQERVVADRDGVDQRVGRQIDDIDHVAIDVGNVGGRAIRGHRDGRRARRRHVGHEHVGRRIDHREGVAGIISHIGEPGVQRVARDPNWEAAGRNGGDDLLRRRVDDHDPVGRVVRDVKPRAVRGKRSRVRGVNGRHGIVRHRIAGRVDHGDLGAGGVDHVDLGAIRGDCGRGRRGGDRDRGNGIGDRVHRVDIRIQIIDHVERLAVRRDGERAVVVGREPKVDRPHHCVGGGADHRNGRGAIQLISRGAIGRGHGLERPVGGRNGGDHRVGHVVDDAERTRARVRNVGVGTKALGKKRSTSHRTKRQYKNR